MRNTFGPARTLCREDLCSEGLARGGKSARTGKGRQRCWRRTPPPASPPEASGLSEGRLPRGRHPPRAEVHSIFAGTGKIVDERRFFAVYQRGAVDIMIAVPIP